MKLLCKLFFLFPIFLLGTDVSSQELSCSGSSGDIYTFTIPASSPNGDINLLLMQYDAKRRLPISSTAFFDSMNQNQAVDRVDNFRKHECNVIVDKQMECSNTFKTTPEQQEYSGKTAFDRGHLQPVNPMRFSTSAVNNTFFCVNISPQDPYTNQGPWFTVEDQSHRYFTGNKAGYVMTGVCDRTNVFSPTLGGYEVPDCFWKMVCYKDNNGVTQVVSFIGNNTLIKQSNASAEQAARRDSTTLPRSQKDVLDVMTHDNILLDAWTQSATYLRKNRNSNSAPSAADCRAKRDISDGVRDEWAKLMKDALAARERENDPYF